MRRGSYLPRRAFSTVTAPTPTLTPITSATSTKAKNYWMPFTDNINFKKNPNPKVLESAEGAYYYSNDGSKILDGMSGLWCVNAGHKQKKINDAIKSQLDKLDFAPSFNCSHQGPQQFSEKILELLPDKYDFTDVFFTMCGSTAVDTALKMALAYHKAKGDGGRMRFIGRHRGYHGVGFGGISVGGIMPNRKQFLGNSLPFVDHIIHTHDLEHNAFSKGCPTWGSHLAEDLERVISLHDASSVAAVIIEPVPGSTGVLPPPVGYLEKIREICTKHGILLIFDEVITGFGRTGAPFATNKFDVVPDMICIAKGMTNAIVPAGAVITNSKIFQSIQHTAHNTTPGLAIEFFHGYTYSGHPLAMAAGLATLEVIKEQSLFERAAELEPYWQEAWHSLKGLPNVIDIRNIGLMGALDFKNVGGQIAFEVYDRCFEAGLFVRATGNTIVCSPPLIIEKSEIDFMVETLRKAIEAAAKNPAYKQ